MEKPQLSKDKRRIKRLERHVHRLEKAAAGLAARMKGANLVARVSELEEEVALLRRNVAIK